jgi:hypothetical protein
MHFRRFKNKYTIDIPNLFQQGQINKIITLGFSGDLLLRFPGTSTRLECDLNSRKD